MALTNDDTRQDELSQAAFQELLQEKLRGAVRITLVTILEEEVAAFIGAEPYQRTSRRCDQRNGHYVRDLVTGVGKIVALPVPRTRKGFRTKLFERYKRRQAELDEAICDMCVQGMSQVRVGQVFETLTGRQPSPSTVSNVFHTLEGEPKRLQWFHSHPSLSTSGKCISLFVGITVTVSVRNGEESSIALSVTVYHS